MKKLMMVLAAASTMLAWGEEATPAEPAKAEPAALEKDEAPIFWGFGNYGIYSGYQLYGNLVNCEPTLQGYLEGNLNLPMNLGYFGLGLWSNCDLTGRRDDMYRRAFNEWDFNIHYGKTFFFDDDCQWGLDWRLATVWYWYPHHHNRPDTHTTADINNYFSLVNPFVTPFLNVIHEYHESKGVVLEFGLRRRFQVAEGFALTPAATFVWRSRDYVWCFPTEGFRNPPPNSGMATMKLGLDAEWMITEHFGFFGKVAWCHLIDDDLRERAAAGFGSDYSKFRDFAWGGIGVQFVF